MHRLITLTTLVLISCTTTMTPRSNTREEIVAYVDRAARVIEKSGPSCDTFAQSDWRSGDYYIFVLAAEGVTVCHPAPEQVGSRTSAVVDPNGKRVGEEFLRFAGGPTSSGWVDYVWARPGQTAPEPKSSYARRVTGPDGKVYVVGSGAYGLPR